MSEEARSMRAGRTEAARLVHEFGDPNMGDYQDPYADVSDVFAPTAPDNVEKSTKVAADIEAVRAEFEAMMRKRGVREESQTQ